MRQRFGLGITTGLFTFVVTIGPANDSAAAGEDCEMYGQQKEIGRTWIEAEGKIYGATPDDQGPIGGGKGYAGVLTEGHYRVSGLDDLVEALAKAQAGEVVYIDGGSEIDCTTRVQIEQLVVEIPAGVTLASDRGHEGSWGAIIFSDAFATRPLIRVMGPDVRITGLRIRGPDPERRLYHHHRSFTEGRGHEYYYKFPVSDGIFSEFPDLVVDNCELAGWSHGAVCLVRAGGHHVHHCYIHHNQYNGLGYGISLDEATAGIQYNLFDFNRHSIAGTGRPGTSYEAAYNVEMGDSLSHCFDMHGGRDRKDGTEIAGTSIQIHHNTFRAPQTPIVIRGIPEEGCHVSRNWFPNHNDPGGGERNPAVRGMENMLIEDNRYGK